MKWQRAAAQQGVSQTSAGHQRGGLGLGGGIRLYGLLSSAFIALAGSDITHLHIYSFTHLPKTATNNSKERRNVTSDSGLP